MAKKSVEEQIKELEAKYGKLAESQKAPLPPQQQQQEQQPQEEDIMRVYLEYVQQKYGGVNIGSDVAVQNNLLFAILCELIEIKEGNEEARQIIMREKNGK